MKLLTAKYEGLTTQGNFSIIAVTIENEQGRVQSGKLMFENDGRDLDVEGLDAEYVTAHIEDVYGDDAQLAMLEAELEKGSKDYDNRPSHGT